MSKKAKKCPHNYPQSVNNYGVLKNYSDLEVLIEYQIKS